MNRLIIWRHGQTAWNSAGRIQGQTDVDLDATGRRQVGEAAAILARTKPNVIISSDLRRAYDTARALADLTGVEVRIDKRLRERGYGDWEGLTRDEIAERFPESWDQWTQGLPLHDHGIESHEEVSQRIAAAIADVTDGGEGTVVAVTHGGAARRALDVLTGVSGFANGIRGLDNCSWADLSRRGDSWRLHTYNAWEPHSRA